LRDYQKTITARSAWILNPFRTLSTAKSIQNVKAVAALRMTKMLPSLGCEKLKFICSHTLFLLGNTHHLHYIAVTLHTRVFQRIAAHNARDEPGTASVTLDLFEDDLP
jgi:hypothetical protein